MLPAQADIVESVAKLVEDGTITGVSDVRDESDRTGYVCGGGGARRD